MNVIPWLEGMTIEPGYYYSGMPNETYHEHDSISKSGLDLIERDPYHYFNRKPMEQTRPMQVGSAIHAAILEPGVFEEKYCMLPTLKDRRQPEYKQAVKAYGEGNVFTGNDCENIANIQKAVWANKEASELLSVEGWFELSGFVKDPSTGVVCRHRFDKLNVDGWAVDLKKTQDVRSEKFSRSISDYRYHVQDAFYLAQYEWITGKQLDGMKFICVEEKWPHKVAVYQLCDITREIGRQMFRFNLDMYAQCLQDSGMYHNNTETEIISLPEWVLRQYEDEIC